MKALGFLLFVAGLATFVPAKLEFQKSIHDSIQAYQPWGGIGAAVVGLLLMLAGGKKPAPEKK